MEEVYVSVVDLANIIAVSSSGRGIYIRTFKLEVGRATLHAKTFGRKRSLAGPHDATNRPAY
jgi:hypothetical protein